MIYVGWGWHARTCVQRSEDSCLLPPDCDSRGFWSAGVSSGSLCLPNISEASFCSKWWLIRDLTKHQEYEMMVCPALDGATTFTLSKAQGVSWKRGQKEQRSWRVGKFVSKRLLLGWMQPLHFWTLCCGWPHMACIKLSLPTFRHGRAHEAPPLPGGLVIINGDWRKGCNLLQWCSHW